MDIEELSSKENLPRNLTSQEIESPLLVYTSLFEYAHLSELRDLLWKMLKTLTSDTWHEQTPNDRFDLVLFYEHLEKLLEAAYLLYERQKQSIDIANN
ncbi:MAG: hypothetical protein H7Y42_12580 [Chitinophagaceae bacterium]|nr:hypothetical protein [Chitinophagaceae bacterium]